MLWNDAEEIFGHHVEPAELERLRRRLNALRRALAELGLLAGPEVEPLPTVELGSD